MHAFLHAAIMEFDKERRARTGWVVVGAIVVSLALWTWGGPSLSASSPALTLALEADDTASACVPETRLAGGVPGFYVFDNVWYTNGSLRMYALNTSELPGKGAVVSGWRLGLETEQGEGPAPDVRYDGTTILLNAGSGDQIQYLWHYYHFAAESLLGGFAAAATAAGSTCSSAPRRPRRRTRFRRSLTSARSGFDSNGGTGQAPGRLIVPWVEGWRDQWGINAAVVDALFGNDVVEPKEWRKRTEAGESLFFERLVVVDRWVSHAHNPSAGTWNKMALPAFELAPALGFFEPARRKMLDHFGLSLEGAAPGAHVVVYVDRQGSSRRLRDEDHEGVLEVLEVLREEGNAVRHVQFEGMSVAEQIEAVADASIFPPTTFLRDYQAVAQVLRHPYFCLRNDSVLTEDEWRTFDGETGAGNVHDGSEITLQAPLLLEMIRRLLKDQQ
ncbi:hypothetical protein Q5752_004257 [Cryptotrichosporon argae]